MKCRRSEAAYALGVEGILTNGNRPSPIINEDSIFIAVSFGVLDIA